MGDFIDRDEQAVYTKILNLATGQSRPTHYELLGISSSEQDAKQIVAVARSRMEQLRRGVSPELLRAARVVLKKMERARTCLLDAQARASYDAAIGIKNNVAAMSTIWDELDAPPISRSDTTSRGPSGLNNVSAPIRQPIDLNLARSSNIVRSKSGSQHKAITYSVLGAATLALGIGAFALLLRSNGGQNEADGKLVKVASGSQLAPTLHQSVSAAAPAHSRQADSGALASLRPRQDQVVSENKSPTGLGLNQSAAKEVNGGPLTNAVTLASLPDAVELPAQHATDSALPSNQSPSDSPFEIGPTPLEGLIITIDQPEIMAIRGISFELTSEINRKPGPAWEVRLRSAVQQDNNKEKSALDNIAAGLDEIIARIYVEDGKLKFTWAHSKYSQLAEQLRNCVLCLTCAQETRRIQMRLYQRIAPVVMNFEQAAITVPVNGESFPSSDVLSLEVSPSPAFASKFSIEPNSGKVACNKLLTVKILDDAQKKVEIRGMLRSKGSNFVIVIGPRFKIGSEWEPFTTERINAGLSGLESALQRHRDGLEKARKRASSISSELSSAQSQLASTNDASAHYKLAVRTRGLQTQEVTANRAVAREEKAIPETEKDLANMKQLVEVGNKLRGHAELRLRVSVKTGGGEYDLVRTDTSSEVVAKPH
jgi:hypothetical protein